MSKNGHSRDVFEIDGISVEIDHAVSKDSGLLPTARKIRNSTWFPLFIDELVVEMAKHEMPTHGFTKRVKLEAGVLAIISGLTMGRRSINAVAQSFAADPLWTAVVGRFFNQKDLSRLMEVLSNCGHGPLRRALLFSGAAGQDAVWADMDSSLLPIHGKQEGGAYNGHYHEFGLHAGWAVDVRTHHILAIWLNEGNDHTAKGQDEQIAWIVDQGVKVDLTRFDAGLTGPKLFNAMEGRVKHFVCRIKPNPVLGRLADAITPDTPFQAGARSYGEIRYSAQSWSKEERVVVKFQAPEGDKDAMALIPEQYFFVTSLTEAPADVVGIYQDRGESERLFGEFVNTFRPNFRHTEKQKNEVWAMLLGLAHNVLSDLREQLPKEEKLRKQKVEHRPAFLPEPWVFGYHRTIQGLTDTVLPLLSRVRDMALRVPCELRKIGKRLRVLVKPDILAPGWFPALMST